MENLCECGCGQLTNISTVNNRCKGWIKGKPLRYIVGHNGMKHGHARDETKIYRAWDAMVRRCTNPRHKSWHNYGGRGITVCKEWLSFENFLADMGEPEKGMTLERKDNNKGYYKDNCVWANMLTQANNRRNNRYIDFHGKKLTASQIARLSPIKINGNAIAVRIFKLKWSIEKSMNTPIRGASF